MSLRGRRIRTVGSSAYPVQADGAFNHDFNYEYYRSRADAGKDIRAQRVDLTFASQGSGETLRPRAIVDHPDAAYGGTINAMHATLSLRSGAGVEHGAGNAIRATLEAGGTTPVVKGTVAALQLDSSIPTGATLPDQTAFVRVTDSGVAKVGNLLNIPAAANGSVFATHTTEAMTHSIRIVDATGTAYYIMCTNADTNRGK